MSARTRTAARLRREIVEAAESLERWLGEAQKADDAGNPGAAICLRAAARSNNVDKAYAAARALQGLRA